MPDLENSKPETNELPEQSPEPSPASEPEQQAPIAPPGMGLREITATYEMLVAFKEAVKRNTWPGDTVQAIAMGIQMVVTLESQYRGQMERMRVLEKDAVKRARQAIKDAGGQVHGDSPNGTVPTEPAAS